MPDSLYFLYLLKSDIPSASPPFHHPEIIGLEEAIFILQQKKHETDISPVSCSALSGKLVFQKEAIDYAFTFNALNSSINIGTTSNKSPTIP